MSDADFDDDRFPGVFLGPDEGEAADGASSGAGGASSAGGGDEAEGSAEAVPYVGAGEPQEEDGAGDTGDGT